ncbi:hypothetical protein PG991_003348 [Apiospora marii]|uniref:Uncharacterized protein n=1 Tax=Apiospora marii TaxID=335849 RepID=A0ABR1SJP5_9PEZI
MRFSSFAIVPAGLLSLVHSLPTEGGALSLADSPETFIEGNNSGNSNIDNRLEARAATCNNAYTLKIFKSNTCSGNPTRTEIQNWPLEAGATDRCVNVNSVRAQPRPPSHSFPY